MWYVFIIVAIFSRVCTKCELPFYIILGHRCISVCGEECMYNIFLDLI